MKNTTIAALVTTVLLALPSMAGEPTRQPRHPVQPKVVVQANTQVPTREDMLKEERPERGRSKLEQKFQRPERRKREKPLLVIRDF